MTRCRAASALAPRFAPGQVKRGGVGHPEEAEKWRRRCGRPGLRWSAGRGRSPGEERTTKAPLSLSPPEALGMRPRSPPPWLARWALCLALGHLPAGGFVLHLETDCPLAADGRVLWANWTLAFNKIPFVCYDNEYKEFMPCGLGLYNPWFTTTVNISGTLSKMYPDHGQVLQEACGEQIQSLWERTGGRRTPPNVRVFPVTPQNTPAPLMLACVAWGFYPPAVNISWLQNGLPVTAGGGEPALSNNGDWTYQARLTLPVSPQQGDVYSCRVAHASLPEPITRDWAPGLPLELRARVGASAAVLGLGLLLLLTGLVCWKKRLPEGYIPIEGNTFHAGRA